jgi:polar amino acid transport system substrate-binding protein
LGVAGLEQIYQSPMMKELLMKKLGLIFSSALILGLFQSVFAQELKVGVGMALPPYIIQESDSGIEVEILRQALPATLKPKFAYLPFARVKVSMEDGTVDAVTPVNESAGIKNAFFSKSHITYQNVAVTLKSRAIKIGSIADLSKLRVVAFQDATVYLGPTFAAMAKANSNYSELAAQENQVKMLFAERADTIVMDINIYKFFKSKIKDIDVSKEVTIAEIFPPTEYKVAFKSRENAELFNTGLDKLRSSGQYAAILKKYTQ